MKDCRCGLYMGALFMPLIVLSQAVFPSRRSDDDFGGLIHGAYLDVPLLRGSGLSRCARLRSSSRRAHRGADGGRRHGTDLRGVGNLFLETVSKQVEKIRGFEHMSSPRIRFVTVYLYSQFIFPVNLV
jgi:hypothetical protein